TPRVARSGGLASGAGAGSETGRVVSLSAAGIVSRSAACAGPGDVAGAGSAAISGVVLAPSQVANSGGTEGVGCGAGVAAAAGSGGIRSDVTSSRGPGGCAGFGRPICVGACEPDGLCTDANGFSIGEERISFSLAAASSGVMPSGCLG